MLCAAPTFAHAVLEGSDPRPDSVLATLPPSVTLTYDESVTLMPTSLQVFSPSGVRVDDGDVAHPGGKGDQVSVHLGHAAAQGTYLVSWRVISADSHPVSGAYTFSVGRTSAAPKAPSDSTDPTVGVLLGGARWLGYAGSALLVGGLLVLAWCWREGWQIGRSRRLAGTGAVLLGVGTVADILLKGSYDAALGVGSIGQGRLLREVLGTTYGHAAIARLLLTVVLGVLIRLSRPPRDLVLRLWLVTPSAIAVGVTFALSGHAAAGSGRVTATVSDTLHVLAASIWLGGLVLVLAVVLPLAESGRARRMVARFSEVAVLAVVALVVSGLYQALRQVGSWGALTGTTYGRELLIKVGVVCLVVAVAAGSRAWVGRSLRTREQAPEQAPGPHSDVRPLRRSVLVEVLGLVVVLGLTSALVATQPAKTAYHPTTSASLTIEGDTVQVSAVPSGDRQVELHVYLFGKDDQPTDPKQIQASVSLPSAAIDALPVALQNAGPGHRIGTIGVPIAGTWRLAITLRTSAIDEATGYVSVPIH